MSLPTIRLQIAAVTLAEELNFSRAADRLKITQPALSKQIAELETSLGFVVFDRRQRGVELTDAGQVFVRGCIDAIAILEGAVRTARANHDSIQPVVTIGHTPYIDPTILSTLLAVHLPLHPNLRLRMESRFAHELTHGVLSAELDIAIVEEPVESGALTAVPLLTQPLHVLMARDHLAANQHVVEVGDFADVGWMLFPKRANPATYDRILETARLAGISPIELHHYMVPQEVVQLILGGFGVAFMPLGIATQLENQDLVSRPLGPNAVSITSHLVLGSRQTSRLVNEFGRAFLKRITPSPRAAEVSGQLLLNL